LTPVPTSWVIVEGDLVKSPITEPEQREVRVQFTPGLKEYIFESNWT